MDISALTIFTGAWFAAGVPVRCLRCGACCFSRAVVIRRGARAALQPAEVRSPYLSFDGTAAVCAVHDEPWFARSACSGHGRRGVDRRAAGCPACGVGSLILSSLPLRFALRGAPCATLEELEELGPWDPAIRRHPGTEGHMSQYRLRRQRFRVQWRARIQCPDWLTVQRVATANVSRGGLFLTTANPPPPGTEVELELELPDGTRLSLGGTCVHVRGPRQTDEAVQPAGFGLRFERAHAVDLMLLEEMARVAGVPVEEPPVPLAVTPAEGVPVLFKWLETPR